MNINPEDLELLVELTSLISKYGKKRIIQVIALLNNHESIEKMILLLNEAIELADKNSPPKRNAQGMMIADENSLLIERINKLLKDNSVFKTTSDLDHVLKIYLGDELTSKKKPDMIKVFNIYLSKLNTELLNEVLNNIYKIVQEKRPLSLKNETDLSKWSNIIVKNKDSKEI